MAPTRSVTEWLAEIPDTVSPRDGLRFIREALDDAQAAVDAIRAQYAGGTLPPPPWPETPDLAQAREALEGGQLMLNQAIALGMGDTKEPKTGPHAVRLINGGRALYKAIDAMNRAHREGEIKPENAVKLVSRAAGAVLPTIPGGLLLLFGLIYLLERDSSS